MEKDRDIDLKYTTLCDFRDSIRKLKILNNREFFKWGSSLYLYWDRKTWGIDD